MSQMMQCKDNILLGMKAMTTDKMYFVRGMRTRDREGSSKYYVYTVPIRRWLKSKSSILHTVFTMSLYFQPLHNQFLCVYISQQYPDHEQSELDCLSM